MMWKKRESSPNKMDITKNFKHFLRKWSEVVDSSGRKGLSDEAIKARKI